MLELLLIGSVSVIRDAQPIGPANLEHARFNRVQSVDVSNGWNDDYYMPLDLNANVLYRDSSVNQYGFFTALRMPMFKHGDTIAVVMRRYTTDTTISTSSGIIGVAWSFDGGATWNTANFVNANTPDGNFLGRYPHFAGFTSDGRPVVSWPELVPGPAWGYMCIGVVDPADVNHQVTCTDNYETYRSVAWKVGVDTFAVIGTDVNGGIHFWLYDAANNAMIGTDQLIRDPNAGYAINTWAIKVYGDSALIFGSDANGVGYFVVRKDGTTDPAVGTGTFKTYIAVEAFTYRGVDFSDLFMFDAALYDGTIWVAYTLADPAGVDAGDPAYGGGLGGDILVTYPVDDTGAMIGNAYIFANLDGSSVNELWTPYDVRILEGNGRYGVMAVWFTDNADPGCYTSTTPSDKDIIYVYTEDGGATWTAKYATEDGKNTLEDFIHPAWNGYAGYQFGDTLYVAYMIPADGQTDIACNVYADNGVTGAYDIVAYEPVGAGTDAPVGTRETFYGSIRVVANQIIVTAPEASISVYNIKGAKVAAGKDMLRATLKAGTYFVKVGDQVRKVVIR